MGTIVKGEHAVADLAVRNLGGGPLTVAGVSTSCGCTTATLTPMVIPAGGEGRLHIEYDSIIISLAVLRKSDREGSLLICTGEVTKMAKCSV